MTTFPGITREVCETAWSVVTPAIEQAHAAGLLNGLKGSVIVLDPAKHDGTVGEHNTLFVGHVGVEDPQFLTNIIGKAKVTARTGLDSEYVREQVPHLYIDGDIKWPGAVMRHGLIVAFSGVQGEFDVMIAEWMVSAIRAICRDRMLRPGGAASDDGPYLSA